MVKKLYKHEFLAWLRVVPIIFGITLLSAVFNRIIFFFETDSIYYEIVSTSTLLLFFVSMMVSAAAPLVFGIVRFYKNFFTGEGYLTFTLPVNTTFHLLVKVTTAFVFDIASFLVCVASFCILTAGDILTEIWKAGIYLWNQIPQEYTGHLAGYIAEGAVLFLVAIFTAFLLYVACMCIGQLAKKNRILLAVGAYFVYYIITQILSTIFIIVFTILETTNALEPIYHFVADHPWASVHMGLCGMIVLEGLLALVYWLVCRFILRKKLNLE